MARICVGAVGVGAVALVVFAGLVTAQEKASESPEIGKEQEFLRQFAGVWDCDGEAYIEPGKPPTRIKSSMTGHLIGNFWAILVVRGDAPGQPYHGQGTFGYDSRKKKFVGTWTDSMSDFLWLYEGTLHGNKLVLNSKGPNPADPREMVEARDTWDFKSKDLVVLTSEVESSDGKMTTTMTATCKRKR